MSASVNLPPCNNLAMTNLRSNPDKAYQSNFYLVQSTAYTGNTETIGGPCSVKCVSHGKNKNVFELQVTPGNGDYFYPYVHIPYGGVGTCVVPKNAPLGTLVLTGAMNGCSLQVNDSGSNLHFYHDANGVSLKGKLTPGNVVARVNYETYAGPGNLANNMTTKEFPAHVSYLVTVRGRTRWYVYSSTFLYGKKVKNSWFGGISSTEVFEPVITSVSRLLCTF
ncbi:hypothetical protein [Acidocella facilis]|uniref:hypothetical protein n=1 Tax=Acidocella facilis TaxID=525 RepID=UPI001F1EA6DB|nr:hypothetical protein [Acidocella facilis]